MAITKVINDLIDLNATGATKSLKMPSGAAYSGTTEDGMVRNDTDGTSQGSASTMQHFNGTDWKNYENLPNGFTADFLVVAGGAGGGGFNNAGGGGAGGLRTSYPGGSGGGQSSETSLLLSLATPYDVVVGPGGAGGTNSGSGTSGLAGTNSEFNGIISSGGGSGGKYDATGGVGGSGGGGGYSNQAGGAAVTSPAIQGYAGQAGVNTAPGYIGGGAGGAGETGGTDGQGHGGDGLQVNIDGLNNFYAGGGSGGANNQSIPGSSGGGGNGGYVNNTNPGNGTINTGGGGGGASGGTANTGGNGGAGVVILRYPTASVASYQLDASSGLDTTANIAYPIANTAYFKLEGGSGTTVTDSSGNGYNGTATSVTYSAGRFGQAAVFNGSTIPLSSSPFTNTQDVSVSLWVKDVVAPSSGYDTIFVGDGNDYFYITVNPSGEIRTYIDNYQDPVYPRTSYQLETINSNITNGDWHHIVVVSKIGSAASGGGYEIYVDGTLNVSYSYSSTIRRNAGGAWTPTFGTYGAGVLPLNGKLDQTRIFTSAISDTNVTSLYNESTVVESTDGTDSILQFIGGTGTVTFS